MTQQISENTQIKLDLKTIGIIVGFTISLATTYLTLSASVSKNSEDVITLQENSVNPIEFQYKDELVRSTVQRLEEKQDVLSKDINEIKENLQKIDDRLYQLSRK
jgi:outer membrane murein-binding lipoprotein Lpp